MDGGASGYITDLVYPGLFHRETSPAWIAMAAAAIGQQAPDLARPFRYLDLGCGVGLNTALLAAANPHARFIGVDINPDHIAGGGSPCGLSAQPDLRAGRFRCRRRRARRRGNP